MREETAGIETPIQYVESHYLTRELERLGVTDEQRQAMLFRGTNKGWPFDRWSYTWLGEVPNQAIPLVKAYCALKWLVLENPTSSRDKEDAWRLVAVTIVAPTFAIGERARNAQSKRAKNPRGRITHNGPTIGQAIAKLALTRPSESAKELWTHLRAVLEGEGLTPGEVVDPKNPQGFAYEYDFNDRRKRISFRRFQDVVSKARRKKTSH